MWYVYFCRGWHKDKHDPEESTSRPPDGVNVTYNTTIELPPDMGYVKVNNMTLAGCLDICEDLKVFTCTSVIYDTYINSCTLTSLGEMITKKQAGVHLYQLKHQTGIVFY